MTFEEYLPRIGIPNVLKIVPYRNPTYENEQKVFSYLADICKNQRKVYIYGDYDVDGAMCALIINDALSYLNVKNKKVYRYTSRTHALDISAAKECYQLDYEYMIVCDTGSSMGDLGMIKFLCDSGIKVIVLDHHESPLDYSDLPDNVAMVNTTIENRHLKEQRYQLSAAALCFTVMYKFIECNAKISALPLIAYALVSLYSDCMDMSNELNRAIYWKTQDLPASLIPSKVRYFMSANMAFTRRFIEFQFSPRINTLFRSERFDLLNQYFFPEESELSSISNFIQPILDLHSENRAFVNEITDSLIIEDSMQSFVYCDLSSQLGYDFSQNNRVYNYTGLVAQKLTDRYKKAAVVTCQYQGINKGSLRDLYGRNYLKLFQSICQAGGHNSAFGLQIDLFGLDYFVQRLREIDEFFTEDFVPNKPITIKHKGGVPDEELCYQIARYNDFSGQTLPVAYLSKVFDNHVVQRFTQDGFYYLWHGIIIGASYEVPFGTAGRLKPYLGDRVKLQLA